MTKIQTLADSLDQLAPPILAESWDAIGLQVGDPQATVSRVLLTLDVTSARSPADHQPSPADLLAAEIPAGRYPRTAADLRIDPREYRSFRSPYQP
jgi:hypothetical protein